MALRERKKAVLRDKLVRIAVRLFDEKGYDAVNLDEIVAAAMCSRSTLHRYFGTKEDLLFPTANERLQELSAQLQAARPDNEPWSVIRREVSAALCGFLDDFAPDLRAQCIALWVNEPTPRRRYLEIVMEWEHVISGYLAPHLASSASPVLELQLLSSSISSALRAALNTAMQTGEDVRVLINRAFDLLETGVSSGLLTLNEPAKTATA